MIGTFILNPPEARNRSPARWRRKRPFSFTVRDNARTRGRMYRANAVLPVSYNPRPKMRRWKRGWHGHGQAHAVAAKIGWTYRKYASDPRRFGAYAARGTNRGKHRGLTITKRSLKGYRKARSYTERALASRREWFRHKTTPKRTYSAAMVKARRRFGMTYNATAYQRFIGRRVKGARGPGEARRRFKAAVSAWRKGSRRNPVLPGVDYGPSAVYNKKRRSRKGRRRNPVYRTRRGRYSGKAGKGYRRLRRQKGGGWHQNSLYRTKSGRFAKRGGRRLRRYRGGGWKANQIWGGTPNRKHYRRGRRRSNFNGAILPYTAFNNPVDAITGTFEKLTDVELWTGTILPIAGGFLGTHIVAYQGFKLIAPKDTKYEGFVKHGSRLVSSVVLSAGAGIILKDADIAAKVLAGGLVAVLGGIVEDIIGLAEYKKLSGMSEFDDLSEDLTEDLKKRIAEGVKKAVEGGGGGDSSVSAFVTEEDLRQAPKLGDFLTEQGLRKATVDVGGASRGGQPLADLDVFQDALADGSLI